MMEQGQDCREIVTQLSAARNAIDRAVGVIVSSNLEHCVRESVEKKVNVLSILSKKRLNY
ncbi:hypothetical protein GCM10020331_093780 [Ectobacillus funiculus]